MLKRKVKACWHHVLLEDQISNCYMLFTVAIPLPMLHSQSSVDALRDEQNLQRERVEENRHVG